jgi:hypothetical protein
MRLVLLPAIALVIWGCESTPDPVTGEWTYGSPASAAGLGESNATLTFAGGQATFGVRGMPPGRSGPYRIDGGKVVIEVEGATMIFTPDAAKKIWTREDKLSAFYRK